MTLEEMLSMAGMFSLLSLNSFGGSNVILGDLKRYTVDQQGWITGDQFVDMFAMSRILPGPYMLLTALIGLQAGGIWAALVALLATFAPPAILSHVMARGWGRLRGRRFAEAVETGLSALSIGLIFAGALVMLQTADAGPLEYVIAAASAVVMSTTKWSPFVPMAGGAAAGLLAHAVVVLR